MKNVVLDKLQELTYRLLNQDYLNFKSFSGDHVGKASHSGRYFSECECRHLGLYIEALREQGLWSLVPAFDKLSIDFILYDIRMVHIKFSPTDTKCSSCTHKMEQHLEELVEWATFHFPGLCLDCVKHGVDGSKKKGRSYRISHAIAPFGMFGLGIVDVEKEHGRLMKYEVPWDFSMCKMGEFHNSEDETFIG